MNMRKTIIILAVFILVLAGGYYWYSQRSSEMVVLPPSGTPPPASSSAKTYQSRENGLSLKYPQRYTVEEFESGGPEPYQSIVFSDPALGQGIPEGSEAPPAISIDVFPGVQTSYGLSQWLKDTRESNFNLSSGSTTSLTVSGASALRYRWSGLYEGESVAVIANGNAYVFSVTYHTPSDQIRKDFDAMLSTVQFQ